MTDHAVPDGSAIDPSAGKGCRAGIPLFRRHYLGATRTTGYNGLVPHDEGSLTMRRREFLHAVAGFAAYGLSTAAGARR